MKNNELLHILYIPSPELREGTKTGMVESSIQETKELCYFLKGSINQG